VRIFFLLTKLAKLLSNPNLILLQTKLYYAHPILI